MKTVVMDIKTKFEGLGVDIPAEQIEEKLDKLITKFKVPQDEAQRNVINHYLKEYDISRGEFYAGQGELSITQIADIIEDGKWVNLKGKVIQLWEKNHDSISQVGLFGDETGSIKFTKWSSAELQELEENKSYIFKNVVINSWNDKLAVNLNKSSSIEEIEENIEVGNKVISFTGAMIDIQAGSGLIKRCPNCKRALTKGACVEHGKVDGIYDLRLKIVIDNGLIAQDAILKRDITESIADITLDKAIAMAADALDPSVVLEEMKEKLVGKYYTITGPRVDRYILVESIYQESDVDQKMIENLIHELEVI